MKKLSILFLIIFLAFVLSSCGGSGGLGRNSSDSFTASGIDQGNVRLAINWGQGAKRAKDLSAAYSVKVNVCNQVTTKDGVVYERTVNAIVVKRPLTNTTDTEIISINGIPIGPKTVIAQAYNASGEEISHGTTSVTIVKGLNNGVTVSVSDGVFTGTIIGSGDVATPTESSTYPNILRIGPATGPAGTAVTLMGTGFGNFSASSVLIFGGLNIAPTSWTNNAIVFNVPQGFASGSTNVKVNAGGQISNTVSFFVTQGSQGPQITSITPANGQVGTNITITGSGFGSATSGVTPLVIFGGGVSIDASSWSETRIQCQVPRGAATGLVTVSVNRVLSNGVNFIIGSATSTWTSLNVPNYTGTAAVFKSIWCTANPFRAYVAGVDSTNNGLILKYDGANWTRIIAPTFSYTGIFGINDGVSARVFAVGSTDFNGKIISGGLNDTSWAEFTSYPIGINWPYTFWPNDLWVKGQGDLFVAGQNADLIQGSIAPYANSAWANAPINCPGSTQLSDIWMSYDNQQKLKGFVVSPEGYTRLFTNNTWQSPVTISGAPYLQSVWGNSDATVFFAVGNGGKAYRWVNGTWTAMTTGTTESLISVWGTSNNNVYAVGTNGKILHFDGTSWTSMTSGTTSLLFAVFGVNGGDVIAVGRDGTALTLSGGGIEVQ